MLVMLKKGYVEEGVSATGLTQCPADHWYHNGTPNPTAEVQLLS